jgi:putative transposase
MAHKNCIFNQISIIHHSDRDIQYCCLDYSQFAKKKDFVLSTTKQYDPNENSIAQRSNGMLKYEFGLKNTIKTFETAQKMTAEAVELYNNQRMHWSLDLKNHKMFIYNMINKKIKITKKKRKLHKLIKNPILKMFM